MSIKLPDTIRSNNSSEYGIVQANETIGSKVVQTVNDLYTIPDGLLTTDKSDPTGPNSVGNLWYVAGEDKYYYLSNFSKRKTADGWKLFYGAVDTESCIPVLDQDRINRLIEEGKPIPEDYIEIPNKDPNEDLSMINEDPTIGPSKTYLDILFSSIRALQAEVAKLKNTMKYGMYSYTDSKTAMSHVVSEYEPTSDKEPLWAIEESDLSQIDDAYLDISERHNLTPAENVEAEAGILKINSSGAKWEDPSAGNGFKACQDAKLFLYLTTSKNNVKIELRNNTNNQTKILDISQLGIPKSLSGKYNVMIAISRAYKSTSDTQYYGKNFIWVQATSYGYLQHLIQGYWNPVENKLQEELYELGDETTIEVNRWYIKTVEFKDMYLYKFNAYSKYQDFSTEVQPQNPDDSEYKYEVAHITIRSVKNEDVLKKIVKQLPKNELIYNEANNGIYIINKVGSYKQLNTNSKEEDTGMTQAEIKEWLRINGIHITDDGSENITIDNLADITFIHQETGKAYKFSCTSDGQLKSQEVLDTDLESRMENADYVIDSSELKNTRGFVGKLCYKELVKEDPDTPVKETSDIGLRSDRIKIAAIYAPNADQKTYGCSHAYIELENSSDKDFELKGCYLHVAMSDGETVTERSLALDGVIPAGGTFLVRGKQYIDFDQANCFIKVKTYDQEWYDNYGELIDLTLQNQNTYLLTYGLPGKDIDLTSTFSYEVAVVKANADTSSMKKVPYLYHPRYIDSVSIGNHISHQNVRTWTTTGYTNQDLNFTATAVQFAVQSRDCIYKNTFELDPAKQAFQSLNSYDSSRYRNANEQDYQYLFIDDDKIEFPKTDDVRPVEYYTPKASFEKKNVSTDKSKLDANKPNMVTCSFGIDMHKTRCFNWVSTGSFNEFLWLRKKNTTTWSKFESYKGLISTTTSLAFDYVTDKKADGSYSLADIKSTYVFPTKYVADLKATLKRVQAKDTTPTYQAGHYIIDADGYAHTAAGQTTGDTYTITYTLTYNAYNGNDLINDSNFVKKTFGVFDNKTTGTKETVESVIYDRMEGIFPGCGTHYTVHKCIVDINGNESATSPIEYEYVVGRADKNGNPNSEHSSEIQTFTIYPETYIPKVFQITDQQGFHWIEYQVWAAAAHELNKTINEQTSAAGSKIIPVLINTGDMTQNGTRINEWYDYYMAGRELFSHIEQMNVVGNNDLCGTDPEILGTGDDIGKSNGFYFHVCYCYEVDPTNLPIISNTRATHYIPSFYYFGNTYKSSNPTEVNKNSYRFLMTNSEITIENCKSWYQQIQGTDTINIYTGWPISEDAGKTYDSSFTTIYSMMYKIINGYTGNNSNIIAVCHEMPFTVITNTNLLHNYEKIDRSLSEKASGSLVGCHMNKLGYQDKYSNYWFSRLLESFGIKLCIGGHKHTYACTNPIREFYYWGDDYANCSLTQKMPMEDTLSSDSVKFTTKVKKVGTESRYTIDGTGEELEVNTTKYPLMQSSTIGIVDSGTLYPPCYGTSSLTDGIVYFMLQATGYKLKSNKELPSPSQKYSYIIPKTNVTDSGDKPDANQQYPMYAEIVLNSGSYDIYICRIENIMEGKNLFSQISYSTKPVTFKYLTRPDSLAEDVKIYGKWVSAKGKLITV